MKSPGQTNNPQLPNLPDRPDADATDREQELYRYTETLNRKLYQLFSEKQILIDAVIPYTPLANQFLTSDVTGAYPGNVKWQPTAPVGVSNITVKDEGVVISTTVSIIDFVGAGVTATGGGATATVTIPGGGAGGGGFDWGKSIASVHHRAGY